MSCYNAIVPVAWARLTEVIVPAWVDAFVGRRTIAAFGAALGLDQADHRYRLWEHNSSYTPVSPSYLDDIGWAPGMTFVDADRLRAHPQHAELSRRIAGFGVHAMCAAVRVAASVELAGADPFENHSIPGHYIYTVDHFRFYARLHHAPHVQVAGTKNDYHFLHRLFTSTFIDGGYIYEYAPLPTTPPALRALCEALFLSTRAFPGTSVLARAMTWPGSDDSWIQGMLAPHEVQAFVPFLDGIAEVEAAHENGDTLFPMFADRVRRAAAQGLGLVTLHAEL